MAIWNQYLILHSFCLRSREQGFSLGECIHYIYIMTLLLWYHVIYVTWFSFQLCTNKLMRAINTVQLYERHGVSNHREPHCLPNYLFRLTSKLPITDPLWRESIVTVTYNAKNISMSSRLQVFIEPKDATLYLVPFITLRWRHNERDGVSNHQRLDYFLNRLFRGRSKKTSKLRVTGLGLWGEFTGHRWLPRTKGK